MHEPLLRNRKELTSLVPINKSLALISSFPSLSPAPLPPWPRWPRGRFKKVQGKQIFTFTNYRQPALEPSVEKVRRKFAKSEGEELGCFCRMCACRPRCSGNIKTLITGL
eukprot:1362652-Amorphochlora_amoeboformis.AAC.2